MININSGLVYVPRPELISKSGGEALFKGIPCPTKEVFDLIGTEGVSNIHNTLQNIIKYRRLISSDAYIKNKGILGLQAFDHYPSMKSLTVQDPFIIDSWCSGMNLYDKINKLKSEKKREILLKIRLPKEELKFPDITAEPDFYFIQASGKSQSKKEDLLKKIIEFKGM